MKKPFTVTAFALTLALASHAQAADDLLIAGLGSAKCSDFIAAEGAGRDAYLAWAEGYMSGINATLQRYQDPAIPLHGADTMSAERQVAYITEHCEISPDSPFFSAAADLFSALSNVAGQ